MYKKIKIAQIIWGLDRGGAELLLLQLCKELIKTGRPVEITVVVFRKFLGLLPDFERVGIKVICLDLFGKPFYKKIIATYRLFTKIKPEVIHTHMTAVDPWALIAGLFAGVRHRYTTVHNVEQVCSFKDKLTRMITSLLAVNIIAVSRTAKKFYIRRNMYPSRKLKVIYNCPSFSSDKVCPKLCPEIKKSDTIKIINIGNLRVQKGHIHLVRAMHDLQKYSPKYRLEIYGRDFHNYKTVLMGEIEKLRISSIRFNESTDNVPEVLNSSHLLVASSVQEAFHMVVVEAMSLGLPLVASDIPVHKELLEGVDSAVFYTKNNPEELAQAVNNLITNPVLYNTISRQVIERSKDFSISNTVDTCYNLYRQTTGCLS